MCFVSLIRDSHPLDDASVLRPTRCCRCRCWRRCALRGLDNHFFGGTTVLRCVHCDERNGFLFEPLGLHRSTPQDKSKGNRHIQCTCVCCVMCLLMCVQLRLSACAPVFFPRASIGMISFRTCTRAWADCSSLAGWLRYTSRVVIQGWSTESR
jgi:hypothetical protein